MLAEHYFFWTPHPHPPKKERKKPTAWSSPVQEKNCLGQREGPSPQEPRSTPRSNSYPKTLEKVINNSGSMFTSVRGPHNVGYFLRTRPIIWKGRLSFRVANQALMLAMDATTGDSIQENQTLIWLPAQSSTNHSMMQKQNIQCLTNKKEEVRHAQQITLYFSCRFYIPLFQGLLYSQRKAALNIWKTFNSTKQHSKNKRSSKTK